MQMKGDWRSLFYELTARVDFQLHRHDKGTIAFVKFSFEALLVDID